MPNKAIPSVTSNLQVIRSLNLLALGSRTETGDSIAVEGNHDIARLEAKVDILLSIVGSLVAAKLSLPPLHPVRFSVESVTVDLDRRYTVGQSVVVELNPNPELPHPLVLAARVGEIMPVRADLPGQIGFEFDQLNSRHRRGQRCGGASSDARRLGNRVRSGKPGRRLRPASPANSESGSRAEHSPDLS